MTRAPHTISTTDYLVFPPPLPQMILRPCSRRMDWSYPWIRGSTTRYNPWHDNTDYRVQVSSTPGNRVSHLEVSFLFPPICEFHMRQAAHLKENQVTTEDGYLLFHQLYHNSHAENFMTEELTLILLTVVVLAVKPAFWRNICMRF